MTSLSAWWLSVNSICPLSLYSAWVTPDWASTGNEEQASRQLFLRRLNLTTLVLHMCVQPEWKDTELCVENILVSKRKQTHKAQIAFKWRSAAATRTAHFCQPLFFSSFATNSMSRSSTLWRVRIDPHPDKLYQFKGEQLMCDFSGSHMHLMECRLIKEALR